VGDLKLRVKFQGGIAYSPLSVNTTDRDRWKMGGVRRDEDRRD